MKARLINRIRSERGESIGEALAAMLIVALGALMLEVMTSAATKIVTRSEKAYNSYLDQRNYIESQGRVTSHNAKDGESTYETETNTVALGLRKSVSDSMAATATIPVKIWKIKNSSTGKTAAAWYQYQAGTSQQETQTDSSGE